MKFVAVLVALGCFGCLYSEPLAPGMADPVDRRLLGAWRCVTAENDALAILTVTEGVDRRYRAEFSEGEGKGSVFSAYVVKLEGRQLANAQEVVDGEPRKWTLAQYTLYRPTVLHIEFARDEPFREAVTGEQRVAALKRALKDKQLFEDYCTCVRVKDQ